MSWIGVWLYVLLFASLLAAGVLVYFGITGQHAFARQCETHGWSMIEPGRGPFLCRDEQGRVMVP
jgi:hypothetical protein